VNIDPNETSETVVLIPFRVFIDSDLTEYLRPYWDKWVLIPFRVFIDSDVVAISRAINGRYSLNTLPGIY